MIPQSSTSAPVPDAPAAPGQTWTPTTLGSLAYCLFALHQPGPVSELRTREEARAEGLFAAVGAVTTPGPESDPLLRRQNLLGELSQLNF